MRIAIAGPGCFGRHLIEELTRVDIEVVVLTRSHKVFLDGKSGVIEQRITDYSSPTELAKQIQDCDALVSAIQDQSELYGTLHFALLEAVKLSPKCKRFIPSEYGGNTEELPHIKHASYEQLKDALKAQSKIEWTVIATGWLTDYVVPTSMRYHADGGPFIPLDVTNNKINIPGTGSEPFAMTSARDCGKAVAALLKSTTKWNHYTYIQGEETTWLKVAELMKSVGGMPDLETQFQSADELQAIIAQGGTSWHEIGELVDTVSTPPADAMAPLLAMAAGFKLMTLTSLKFDQEKVARDRKTFFGDVHFRTVKEALEFVKTNPNEIF
jgi:nucleoside-diphosphate-sugar epimerase